jgi:hypothetical protein
MGQTFDNVNRSRNWGNNSQNVVSLPLPPSLTFDDLVALRLETHATGGVGGDNWNLDRLTMRVQLRGETRTLLERSAHLSFVSLVTSVPSRYPCLARLACARCAQRQ